jgi:ankyrin repeat protein
MIHEKERLGIDVANLVDESNFNQNAAFSAAVIKSEE